MWTDAGESDWSDPAWWEMGLLRAEDWVAHWIEPAEADDPGPPGRRPAQLLRSRFILDGPVARARLYVTAHGIYEAFINGQRVGDAELTPGLTSYASHLLVQTFDVTELLARGANMIGFIVSDGWFRGQTQVFRQFNMYGDRLALLAQLHLSGPDGTLARIVTGPDWASSTGAILGADLFDGQTVDFRHDSPKWCVAEADGGRWSAVTVRDHGTSQLKSSPAPPVRRIEELRPVAVTRLRPDRQVVDLGQNINGWVRLSALGPRGTTLTLTHGEALDPDGDVTLDHLIPDQLEQVAPSDITGDLRRPFQVDRVTSGGDPRQQFEPRHTTHGFRYVRVEGHPRDLTPDDLAGVVVHTDLRRTGWFTCSDQRLNRLHEIVDWSFRGNACDIPTDCPTRERMGWTGDWQVFAPTAALLYDIAGFSTKWLRDLAAEQRPDGVVLQAAPYQAPPGDPIPHGSAGWSDAAVLVPWEIYRAYGDMRLLEEQWTSMAAWVEYAARTAREGRHPSRVAARPTPASHEIYLLDTGFHWGEWLEPGDEVVNFRAIFNWDKSDVATAYLYRSSSVLAQIAHLLGRADDEARYRDLSAKTRAAWQAEFVGPDGALTPDTQANHVRALAFGLVPDTLRQQTANRLVALIRKAGTHLGTGVLATRYLLPVLADSGYLDVAYELLLQDTPPSWLTMIDRGATTVWEAWEGINAKGIPYASLNHYAKGAAISFLHTHIAGIRLLDDGPAYLRFRIEPMPGDGLRWVKAAHESPYGLIESSWRIEGDSFKLEISIPPGTTAEVRLPDGRRIDAEPGTSKYSSRIHTHTSP